MCWVFVIVNTLRGYGSSVCRIVDRALGVIPVADIIIGKAYTTLRLHIARGKAVCHNPLIQFYRRRRKVDISLILCFYEEMYKNKQFFLWNAILP
jgi:hypothetical protein